MRKRRKVQWHAATVDRHGDKTWVSKCARFWIVQKTWDMPKMVDYELFCDHKRAAKDIGYLVDAKDLAEDL